MEYRVPIHTTRRQDPVRLTTLKIPPSRRSGLASVQSAGRAVLWLLVIAFLLYCGRTVVLLLIDRARLGIASLILSGLLLFLGILAPRQKTLLAAECLIITLVLVFSCEVLGGVLQISNLKVVMKYVNEDYLCRSWVSYNTSRPIDCYFYKRMHLCSIILTGFIILFECFALIASIFLLIYINSWRNWEKALGGTTEIKQYHNMDKPPAKTNDAFANRQEEKDSDRAFQNQARYYFDDVDEAQFKG